MNRKRLYLIDGMSHIYRAYYAIRNLSNSKGFPTNAIFGFTGMLRKLIDEEEPDYLGVAIDREGPTVRHEKLETYKATRKPMPDDLVQQLPHIMRVCEVFRVPVIGCPGYEADDVIGTLAKLAASRGLEAVIVTGDKDMLQLVSENVSVLDTMKDFRIDDAQGVIDKIGVRPEQVADLLGLWGDSSDNIPGAPGIGEKGALELIRAYGSIEQCLERWEEVKRKSYRESLRDNGELIRLSRDLATIRQDLPLELNLADLALQEPDRQAAFDLFAEMEFKSLMQEFLDEGRGQDDTESLRGNAALKGLEALAKEPRVYFAVKFNGAKVAIPRADKVCVQARSGAACELDLGREQERAEWRRFLEEGAGETICWDAKTIMLALGPGEWEQGTRIGDAMLMTFLASPHIGDYSLKRWALEQLHISLEEDADLPGGNSGLQAEVSAIRGIHTLLEPQLEAQGLRRVYEDIELPLVPVLADMERAGVRVCSKRLGQLSAEMEAEIGRLTGEIYEAAGTEFNINSPKQLGEVLFERLNLPATKKTRKTKGYSTDQSVLEDLAENYELPKLVLEYRHLAKLKSTYVDTLPGLIRKETGRVHTSFNQTGAATGRLSSTAPNLQNIPVRTEIGRKIREAFIPEEGNRLVSADYSQVELRILAHLSEDEVLIDAFRNQEDVHERTAREVFGKAAEQNRAEYRRRAKVINFGIVYGLSAFGLAQRLKLDKDEAQTFIDAYFERYKGVRTWLDRTVEEARKTGVVRTLFGRLRPIPDIHSANYNLRQFAERTAVNTPIQGTAADIMKLAMIRTHKSLRDNKMSTRLLLQVHDELVLEAPEDEVQKVSELVLEAMQGAAELSVPLAADLNVADNWKDMK